MADRNDKLARQLQYALEYRVPIERAVGYLMATMRTDPISAFETLRRTARNERRRVSELAGEILARRRVL
ncbi:ANTAR domain-containing protein [Frankia sp. CpI1-P]|uniref:ANTAR domain-containing protein n=1 Tax=Frankia sp. CpI1-P TaxID=1502734 RepID=UPI0021008588|nr:ANTAR domain-containing protein [Frankia sp. CpI1-P]